MESSKDNWTKIVLFCVLLIALLALVYAFASGFLKLGASGAFVYLIYVFLGLISSVVCYGLLSSFGEIQGHKYETTIKLGGAIVGLVVVGGGGMVYERYFHTPDNIDVRIVFYLNSRTQAQKIRGQVNVLYGNVEKTIPVNNQESVLLQSIPYSQENNRLNLDLDCPDFEIDTTFEKENKFTPDHPVYVKLKYKKTYADPKEAELNPLFSEASAVDYIKRPDAKDVSLKIDFVSNSDLIVPVDKVAHLKVLMDSGAPLLDMDVESSDLNFIAPRGTTSVSFEGFIKKDLYVIAKGRTALLTVKYKDVTGHQQKREWTIDFEFNIQE